MAATAFQTGLAVGPAPSAIIPANFWQPGIMPISNPQPTSNSGVPPNSSTATGGGGTASNLQFGLAAASGPVWQQPVFIAIAMMAIAVIMLGHVAHLEIRA